MVWLELADREGFVRTIRELTGQDAVQKSDRRGKPWPGSSQSTHSSVEAGNDRGAKGCRKVKA
jgi:hypothetical protein